MTALRNPRPAPDFTGASFHIHLQGDTEIRDIPVQLVVPIGATISLDSLHYDMFKNNIRSLLPPATRSAELRIYYIHRDDRGKGARTRIGQPTRYISICPCGNYQKRATREQKEHRWRAALNNQWKWAPTPTPGFDFWVGLGTGKAPDIGQDQLDMYLAAGN